MFEEQTEYVRLCCLDGHVFYIEKKCAIVSGTIKAILSGPGVLSYFFKNMSFFIILLSSIN
jgi:hypothetical protein